MSIACAEARKWLGATSPNPAVGAVALDNKGAILALAAHHRAGWMHAEAQLLQACASGRLLRRVHTLCVSLEPCNHFGRTPPCTDAIIRAGIQSVVVGVRDPNSAVKGGGIEHLQQAGIDVILGVAENECQQLIHAYAYHARTGKPWITIKRAFDRNGSMIPPAGQKTFTSPESLRLAHRLRKKADAIITGSGTILADNPEFTIRHVADHPEKKRWLAILDRRGRITGNYLASAKQRGLIPVIYKDIEAALTDLIAKGTQDILVEAGPVLSQAMLDVGLWTMKIDIRQGDTDDVQTSFNPAEAQNIGAEEHNLDLMLPP